MRGKGIQGQLSGYGGVFYLVLLTSSVYEVGDTRNTLKSTVSDEECLAPVSEAPV